MVGSFDLNRTGLTNLLPVTFASVIDLKIAAAHALLRLRLHRNGRIKIPKQISETATRQCFGFRREENSTAEANGMEIIGTVARARR